ncbi:MAG: redoxin domain-containing protein [Candidatus Omnitrophota bacterium]
MVALFFLCGNAFAPTLKKAPQVRGSAWFNVGDYEKITMDKLRGKVVLIFFWTMNDDNCQRDIPFLNDWYTKYKSKGLEIIGVHSFEWAYDASDAVLSDKILSYNIKFPVVSDDALYTKVAYRQLALPSYCLVDRNGFIRARHDGPVANNDSLEIMIESALEQGQSRLLDEEI